MMRTVCRQSLALLTAMSLQLALDANAWAGSPVTTPIGMVRTEITFAKPSLTFAKTPLTFPVNLDTRETPSTIEVTLPADILFDFDKSDLRVEAASTLHNLADIIRAKAHGPVGIRGYTDAFGKDAYNQRLSERRATSVKAWLVGHEQLAVANLATSGFGARDPVAPNRKPDGSDDPQGASSTGASPCSSGSSPRWPL
jgi:outer membrane protein OmpA-like peptidoglycan-associated protein